jgi:thioredoxin reductase (NADPH)
MSFAGTMREQIERLGVRIIRGRAQGIEPGAEMSVGLVRVLVGEDFSWYARSVVIATGSAPISAEVEGERIGPADAWNMDVEGHNVIVLGGGNSAGQVLLHLAERARTVYAVVRSGLKTSAYLTSRIQARHNVVVLQGGVSSERLPDGRYVISHADGLAYVNAKALFSCYGGIPASDWIGCVERDDSGRVLIGNHGYEYGTTQPGVFAIGDVRYGAVQRVPSAIGDGSNVQRDLWGYLNG